MINLPTGTVTFLFTDIEGSTQLWEKHPEAMKSALAKHDSILKEAIESNHGHIIKTTGDGVHAVFTTAIDAIKAAIGAQKNLVSIRPTKNMQDYSTSDIEIKVRMGLHTGEAELRDGDYYGSVLNRAARIMSIGHGGQILLSESTAQLVREHLTSTTSLQDLGEHYLKGLQRPEKIYQLVALDLQKDFPPLNSIPTVTNNLPTQFTSFVGRKKEVAEIEKLVASYRIVTLTGSGGSGKTRLALRVARDLLNDFEDRIYFVDLSSSRDSDAALAAIGRIIGIRESSDKPLLDELKEQIKHKITLLLLDNFEQVMVAAPAMAELLRDCPQLKMLITSREALRVRGENVFPVPPLTLQHMESKHPTVEQLAQSEAVQLFIERAQAASPNFELTNENAPAVAEICARLDSLPLAIELATARLNLFTPQALAERLGNRLKLLRGGARDLPVRQQTLRDTIDWSYEMLDGREQDLFKLLAVFSGATLETVEAVANDLQPFGELDIFEAVNSLVNKNLVRREEAGLGEPRLRMLETIREFAAARLEEQAAFNAAARRAHATFFAEFTANQWVQLAGDGRERTLALLSMELENIHIVWQYWAEQGDLEQLGKLTDSLWILYDARGWYHATVELTKDLLQVLSVTVSTPDRARQEIILQTSLARALLATKGYTEEAERAYARALELCTSAGEVPQLFPVLRGLASFYVLRAEFEKGFQIGERIMELAERLDDVDMRVEGHLVLGENIASLGNLHLGLDHLEKAIEVFDAKRQRTRRLRLGSNPGVVIHNVSALYLWMLGFPERAHKRAGEAVALAQRLDHPFSMCYALFHYGYLNLWLGNTQAAQTSARKLMDLATEHGFQIWSAVAACLCGAAMAGAGAAEDGLALIEPGMIEYRQLRTPPVFWPLLLGLQAGAYAAASRPADGLPLINEALEIGSASTGNIFAPEVLGLKGELLLALGPNNIAEAEALFQLAVNIAQEVKAPMLELRAAMKLSRLWQELGNTEQARSLLNNAYAKMTEGHDMLDLRRAQAILKDLT